MTDYRDTLDMAEKLLADSANRGTGVLITSDEATDLLNELSNLRADHDNLQEANRDWADTAADLRGDLREARRYANVLEQTLDNSERTTCLLLKHVRDLQLQVGRYQDKELWPDGHNHAFAAACFRDCPKNRRHNN